MRKKTKDKKIEPTEKKSRALYKCPEELGTFIENLKFVPPNVELPDKETIKKKYPYNPTSDMSSDERQTLLNETYKKLFNECYEPFSKSYKEVVLQNAKKEILEKHPDSNINDLLWLIYDQTISYYYYHFRNAYCVLRDIAVFFSYLRKNNYRSANERELVTVDGKTVGLPVFSVQLVRDGTKGKIQREVSESFVGIDLDRIRGCEICNRIFWAENKNSFTCSETCRNALRQRRHREKNKEAINDKRRENYRRNKKLKEIRSKK